MLEFPLGCGLSDLVAATLPYTKGGPAADRWKARAVSWLAEAVPPCMYRNGIQSREGGARIGPVLQERSGFRAGHSTHLIEPWQAAGLQGSHTPPRSGTPFRKRGNIESLDVEKPQTKTGGGDIFLFPFILQLFSTAGFSLTSAPFFFLVGPREDTHGNVFSLEKPSANPFEFSPQTPAPAAIAQTPIGHVRFHDGHPAPQGQGEGQWLGEATGGATGDK